MKPLCPAIVLLLGIAAQCFGVGDAVSTVTKGDNKEMTTYQRDGKTILEILLSHTTDPKKKRMLLQRVIFNDKEVLAITDFDGKRAFNIAPKSTVEVGIQQDSSTGVLEGVGLMDDSHGIIELFAVKDSRLTPVSGEELERANAITKDVGKIFQDVKDKKITSGNEMADRAMELKKKYDAKKSDKQERRPLDRLQAGQARECLDLQASSELLELPVQQTRLDVRVVLVFVALVFGEGPADLVVADLTDRHARVYPHRLDGEHLQRPITAKPHVAKTGRHVDAQAQPPDRGAAFDHRHQVVRFGPLDGAAQIEPARIEHQPFGGNGDAGAGLPVRMSSTPGSYTSNSSCRVRL